MSSPNARLWPVRFDLPAWKTDLRAASPRARGHAERWGLRIGMTGGLPHRELKATRAEDDHGLHLPKCVKTRIPDPLDDDPRNSPWGIVLIFERDLSSGQVLLVFLAFGVRHPGPSSSKPSVYERAHRRLQAGP